MKKKWQKVRTGSLLYTVLRRIPTMTARKQNEYGGNKDVIL